MAFAKEAADLALRAPLPDVKRMQFKAVNEIRRTYGIDDAEKIDWITESIIDGCRTYDDITADTGLQRTDIVRLVNDMAQAGKVSLTSIAGTSNGSGRKAVYIHLRKKITEK